MEQSFICPNCESLDIESQEFVSVKKNFDKKNPWSSVLQIIKYGKCKKKIPAHLGERWNDISFQEAQEEWKLKFKEK